MKLILDISINHTGIAHKWFNRDGIWFDRSIGAYHNPDSLERNYYFFQEDNTYHGWFNVDTMPTLNYTSEQLRDIIYRGEDSVLKKWLNRHIILTAGDSMWQIHLPEMTGFSWQMNSGPRFAKASNL